MTRLQTLSILLLIVLFSSCLDVPKSKKPAFIGGFGEMMVVCDMDFWESSWSNDTLKVMLSEYVPASMPAQPQFKVNHVDPKFFKKGTHKFRNIVYVDIGDKYKNQEPNISYTTSEFALDQIIVYVRARTESDMKALLAEGTGQILSILNQKELERKQAALKYRAQKNEERNIREKKGYDMMVPLKYTVLLDTGNVLWMTKITSRAMKGYDDNRYSDVVVTTYPYTDESDFDLENLIQKRDETLKKLSFNPEDESYKKFQEKHTPSYRVIGSGENYSAEIKSMWTTVNKFGGGPSIQYALLDYKNRRIIHADARIYAPNTTKREMLRELEAIIKSIQPL